MQLPNFQIQTGRSWRDCKIFPWTFLASNILLRTFPRPDNFHPHLGHQPPPAVIAKISKLALLLTLTDLPLSILYTLTVDRFIL